jgi:hypothetical protein
MHPTFGILLVCLCFSSSVLNPLRKRLSPYTERFYSVHTARPRIVGK